VPPAERIFVGNARYDSLVLNDVTFCFLAGRRSGTRYHELVPCVATTVEVQARIVQDLERHRVRYVVIRADLGYVPSPGGGKTLDGFIQEKFARVETFGNYSVWRPARSGTSLEDPPGPARPKSGRLDTFAECRAYSESRSRSQLRGMLAQVAFVEAERVTPPEPPVMSHARTSMFPADEWRRAYSKKIHTRKKSPIWIEAL